MSETDLRPETSPRTEPSAVRLRLGKRLTLSLLLAANIVIWLMPDNVTELVARDHEVWFGRFSGSRLITNLAITLGSAAFAFIVTGGDEKRRRRRTFLVIVGFTTAMITILAADLFIRLNFDWPYVLGPMAYHRPPGRQQTGVFVDKPLAFLTYPELKPGYAEVPWTLTTDLRGYRNLRTHDQADIVALGDSFTEGSIVSDKQVWTARLTSLTGESVYNRGMHGYAPQHYLAALAEHGLSLSPHSVILMFYEGNDFRSARLHAKPIPRWAVYVKAEYSPLLRTVSKYCHEAFGRIGVGFATDRLDVLSWLPIGIGEGLEARYYAFPPSFLVEHYVSDEEFSRKSRWRRTREVLTEIKRVCDQAQARLIVAYIPTKAHVVLPLVANRLPEEKVLAFTMLQAEDVELPDAATFISELLRRLNVKERVLTTWCQQTGIAFVSLTDALRQATKRREQAYYTYDDHWTPIGHDIAAKVLDQFMQKERSPD